MTNAIDSVFGGNSNTVDVSLTKAADLIRGAVSKAVADGVSKEDAKAIAKRVYHVSKAVDVSLKKDADGDSVSISKELLDAVEKDASDAVVTGSMSDAMERLSKAITETEPVDKGVAGGSQPSVDKGGEQPSTGIESDDSWPLDFNSEPDKDLDNWGEDPKDLNE